MPNQTQRLQPAVTHEGDHCGRSCLRHPEQARLSLSFPRGQRPRRVGWGELEPGAQLEPQKLGDCSSQSLPHRQQAFSPTQSPLFASPQAPWGGCFPKQPSGPPEWATTQPLARAAWLSLLGDLLRPLTENIIGLYKARDQL